ncbi:hypothetical protein H310_05217 [Aphanomyces invadans]|uniref:Tudor domain-containing protein n=1 Tax=Aphanomyces invadans TaxID=157072 RepID=A0A024UDC4_9STRA|nr:hypothetical protein H310_05217 [Aphanomyces invadans]ETW03872.1 hypothetical protein H310_05217 [Aphanomyces invadans]|eukprot:XP_008868101.1 hypothetical protein H310_05217 [Aphanomyces invadans]
MQQVEACVEAALRCALTEGPGDGVVGYLVALVMEEFTEAQAIEAKRKSKKREVTTFELLARVVEDTLLGSEAELELKSNDIATVIELAVAHLHARFHPSSAKEDEPDNMGFIAGAACVAILAEDDSWHEADVVSFDAATRSVEVRFVEFGNVQWVDLTSVVLADNVLNDVGGDERCAMCERPVHLTEHHLIPRQIHARYLKRGYTRDFLNRCIRICRSCHSKIHSTIDNRTLAEDFNTLEKLLAHDSISKYVVYARKQKARNKPRKQ